MKHPYVDLYHCSLFLAEQKKKSGEISSATQTAEFHQNELKKYEDASSIYSKLLSKTIKIIEEKHKLKKIKTSLPRQYALSNGFVAEYCCHDQLNGSMGKHYDDEPGFVILYSLGCTANFFIKSTKMKQRIFGFESGDVFVFDCSEEAKILHAVDSIESGSCPQELVQKYEKLGCHRYSLQTRMQPIVN